MSKQRGSARLLVFSAAIVAAFVARSPAQGPAPARPSNPALDAPTPEDERERQAMERFLSLLEKSPRRGTSLDRVYGYHVERGTLDALIKRFEDRVARDAERRQRLDDLGPAGIAARPGRRGDQGPGPRREPAGR